MHERISVGASVKSVAILTAASLLWNPRAFKEAKALASAKFNVVVYGVSRDQSGLEADQSLAHRHGFVFESVAAASKTDRGRHRRLVWPRLRRRLGSSLFQLFGTQNRWQIGTVVPELLRAARNANADYYIVHLEQAAWVGVALMREGYNVGVDMEDWYSEDLLPDARTSRPVGLLRELERKLLTRGAHATCPSYAMSKALEQEFSCNPPAIVYNAFQWSQRKFLDGLRKDRLNKQSPSIHWFSQTLGHGRGLEDLLAALPLVNHRAEIHLRGNPVAGFKKWLSDRVSEGWSDRIFVHDLVSNEELLSRIAEHDIGFAGEMNYCRSRDLTVTNKILYYLLAGLAVVASDTAGQREIAEQAPEAVLLYPVGNITALAAHLNKLLSSTDRLRRAKAAALQAAEQTFCWERQEAVLLKTVEQALSKQATANQM